MVLTASGGFRARSGRTVAQADTALRFPVSQWLARIPESTEDDELWLRPFRYSRVSGERKASMGDPSLGSSTRVSLGTKADGSDSTQKISNCFHSRTPPPKDVDALQKE